MSSSRLKDSQSQIEYKACKRKLLFAEARRNEVCGLGLFDNRGGYASSFSLCRAATDELENLIRNCQSQLNK